jgi:hypothetical protein
MRRLVGVLACLALACAGLPPYETPEQRGGSLTLVQVDQPRSGELTWRSGKLQQTAEGVLFEFTLSNGTSRNYLSVMLRLALRGAGSQLATVRYPAGPLAAGASRRVRAHLAPPGFVVEGSDVELLFAQE